eukprot:gene18618-6053_t
MVVAVTVNLVDDNESVIQNSGKIHLPETGASLAFLLQILAKRFQHRVPLWVYDNSREKQVIDSDEDLK